MNQFIIRSAMVLLAIVAMFLVYDFSLHIFPWWIALLSAGSLVGVYIGLGWAPIPQDRHKLAIGISALAMGIEMVYGTLAGLARLSPDWFAMPLPMWAIIALALLHGAPFTVLLFFVSMLVLHSNRDTTQVVNDPYIIVRDIAEQQQEMARQMQAMTNHIERLSTPALTDDTPHMDTTTDDPARAYLDSLAAQYGSLTKAAEAMGVKRQTLYNRANKLKEVER
jgi:hypothetical protein